MVPTVVGTQPTLKAGDLFASRYRILTVLGRGGMGEVYEAADTALDEVIALKLIVPDVDPSTLEIALSSFKNEVRLARRISSRHVVRIHDIGSHANGPYLTMESVTGGDLRRRIRENGPLRSEEAARLAAEVAEGLVACHRAGVLHLDLKPGNVLLRGGFGAVLTDFGIAQLERMSGASEHVVGTEGYMAPEQAAGHGASDKSDIFALGRLIEVMITGKRPGRGALEALRPPDEMARRLVGLVKRCTAKHPGERPSAAEIVALLAAAGVHADEVVVEPPRANADGETRVSRSPDAARAGRGSIAGAGGSEVGARGSVQGVAARGAVGRGVPEVAARGAATGAASDGAAPEAAVRGAAHGVATGGSIDGAGSEVGARGSVQGVAARGASAGAGSEMAPRGSAHGAVPDVVGRGVAAGASTGGVSSEVAIDLPIIAIAPFASAAADEALASALTTHVADLLAQTHGLIPRVLTPSENAAEIGARWKLNCTLAVAGPRVSVDVSMKNVADEKLLWRGRFDDDLDGVLQLQEAIAARIAESLRVRVATFSNAGTTNPKAAVAYLKGRERLARYRVIGPDGAIAAFEEALSHDPGLKIARAGLALATARLIRVLAMPTADELRAASTLIERTVRENPELPDALIAAATLAAFQGDMRTAGAMCAQALRRAPGFADGLAMLGMIKVDCGHADEGLALLTRAAQILPAHAGVHATLLRLHAFSSLSRYQAYIQQLTVEQRRAPPVLLLRMRVALWMGLADEASRLFEENVDALTTPFVLRILSDVAKRRLAGAELDDAWAPLTRATGRGQENFRRQLLCELHGVNKDRRRTLELLEELAAHGSLDVAWIDQCPALRFVASDERFVAAAAQFRRNAAEVELSVSAAKSSPSSS